MFVEVISTPIHVSHRNMTFSKALVDQLSILRHENVLPPVTASGNNLKTCVPGHLIFTRHSRASLVAQRVENLPATQESRVRSLGREDPPGERNPLHYHVLENSRTVSFMGSQSQTCLSGLCVSAARLISRSSLWRPGSLRHDTEDLWICLRKVTS